MREKKVHRRPGQCVPRRHRLRVAAAVLCLAVLAGSARADAQPVDSGAGLVVEEASLPLDASGAPQLDAIDGARERQPWPAALEDRLLDLSAARMAVGEVSPDGAASAPAGALPGDPGAPARVDSGDRDPDRLRSLPPPPRR